MNRKLYLLFIFFFFTSSLLKAQIGGSSTYRFLDLPVSARTASMGGDIISIRDHDLNLALENPSQLNPLMDKELTLNYSPYFSDIKYGYVAFCKNFERLGTFSAGMHFVDYGTFDQTDIYGVTNGTFHAGDYSFNLSFARPLDSIFNVGISLKTIYSDYESYNSFGMAIDAGFSYQSRDKLFGIGLVAKNVGTQLKPYQEGNNEPLPIDVQLGFSKRLSKAPLRINITFTHLEKWDLTYTNPSQQNEIDPITGEPKTPDEPSFFNKTMRHIVVSGEILITENFNLRIGYNYRRRQELSVETRKGLSGFSGGFGLKISKFIFSYGFAQYHLAGSSDYFSITTNLSEFSKKKK